ncbi:MAG: glycosyltransferase family 2 protein [Clostridia bacterium]|nr:glycosyltransferase family 2 protein [Clostridia bacterium]
MIVFYYFEWACIVFIALFAALSLPTLVRFCKGAGKRTQFPRAKTYAKFAVLIPARDESKVIEANIKSVLAANYPADKQDIYIIVETPDDPTVQIVKKYPQIKLFFRENLQNIGKGYALDECLQSIFQSGEPYDAFCILDADNLVQKDFFLRLNDAYAAGYDLACGRRDNKDWNISVVSAASALTFLALNTLVNQPCTAIGKPITVSGTGFFIRAERLKELGGWKFFSLTEDYEISAYAANHGWRSAYVDEAVYYDEQPVKMGQSIVQRSRWVRGFFAVHSGVAKDKQKQKNNTTSMPVICLCLSIIAYLVCLFGFFTAALITKNAIFAPLAIRLGGVVAAVYFLLVLLTVYLFRANDGLIRISKSMKIKAIFFHPIFLFSYIAAAVRAIFMKNTWEKIEHSLYKEIDEVQSER